MDKAIQILFLIFFVLFGFGSIAEKDAKKQQLYITATIGMGGLLIAAYNFV